MNHLWQMIKTTILLVATACGTDAPQSAQPQPEDSEKTVSEPPISRIDGDAIKKDGPEDKDPVPAAEPRASETFFIVVSGGRGSCKANQPFDETYMHEHAGPQREAAEHAGAKSIYILSTCFGDDAETVTYKLVKPDQTMGDVSEQRINTDELLAMMPTVLGGLNKPRLFLTGHSYGGWLVMQLAMRSVNLARPMMLATIDAISPETCSLNNFLNWGIGTFGGGQLGAQVPGCNTFPQDVSASQRQTLRGSFTHWINYYQEEFFPLHSAAIPEASVNTLKSYSAIIDHNVIPRDSDIIQDLAKVIGAMP